MTQRLFIVHVFVLVQHTIVIIHNVALFFCKKNGIYDRKHQEHGQKRSRRKGLQEPLSTERSIRISANDEMVEDLYPEDPAGFSEPAGGQYVLLAGLWVA